MKFGIFDIFSFLLLFLREEQKLFLFGHRTWVSLGMIDDLGLIIDGGMFFLFIKNQSQSQHFVMRS